MREIGLFQEKSYVKMSDEEWAAVRGDSEFTLGPSLEGLLAFGKWQADAWDDAVLIEAALARAGAIEEVDNEVEEGGYEGVGASSRVEVKKEGDFTLKGRSVGETAGGPRAGDILSANNAYPLPIEKADFSKLPVLQQLVSGFQELLARHLGQELPSEGEAAVREGEVELPCSLLDLQVHVDGDPAIKMNKIGRLPPGVQVIYGRWHLMLRMYNSHGEQHAASFLKAILDCVEGRKGDGQQGWVLHPGDPRQAQALFRKLLMVMRVDVVGQFRSCNPDAPVKAPALVAYLSDVCASTPMADAAWRWGRDMEMTAWLEDTLRYGPVRGFSESQLVEPMLTEVLSTANALGYVPLMLKDRIRILRASPAELAVQIETGYMVKTVGGKWVWRDQGHEEEQRCIRKYTPHSTP